MQIGCSVYSFRKEWKKKYSWTLEDFIKIKKLYPEIEGWECLSEFIEGNWTDTESEDLLELKETLKKADFKWFALTIPSGEFGDNPVPHYAGDEKYIAGFDQLLDFRIAFAEEWLENAASVGVKLMRIDCGKFRMDHKIPFSSAFEFNINQNAKAYQKICKLAAEYDIQVGIENHGGFAGDIKVLRKLFEKVPELKLCFDFGNVKDSDRYQMANEFGDRIHYVHAKAHLFREDGEEQNINYGQIINCLKDKGFDGWVSIEWEGPLSGDEGVRKTIDLLKKHIK